jgi:hypothetical protein
MKMLFASLDYITYLCLLLLVVCYYGLSGLHFSRLSSFTILVIISDRKVLFKNMVFFMLGFDQKFIIGNPLKELNFSHSDLYSKLIKLVLTVIFTDHFLWVLLQEN